MIIVRFFLKIILIPIILALTLVKWIFVFLTSFSSVVFFLIAGIALLTALLSYLMGIADQATALRTAASGFLFFMIPIVGEWIADILTSATDLMADFIRS